MNVINQIKTLLGMEVKLEQMALDNGTIIEAEVFEAGASVFIVNEEDRVALPVGEYKLDNGMILKVDVEGIIAAIEQPEEEMPQNEEPVASPAEEQEMEAAPAPKKVIESVVKESHFSQEEVDALKAEIETLKTELSALKNVEVKEPVELSAEPLTHNPESKPEFKLNLYGQKRAKTTFDSVLSKIVK